MKAKRYELIELAVPANTQNRFFFQDIPQLRNATVEAIESFDISAIPLSPNGAATISTADFKKTYLVLNSTGTDKVSRLPLVTLNRIEPDPAAHTPRVNSLTEFENLGVVDWSKSYVQFGSAPAAGAFSILFGVYYRD